MSARLRALGLHLSVMASYLAIALFHLRPLGAMLDTHLPRGRLADVLMQGWIVNWTARALGRDPASLFDANAFFPYPDSLTRTHHLIPQALPVVPLRWLIDDPVTIYNATFLLGFVLSGWFTFLLVRRLTGNPLAAWVAGAFACWFPAKRWSLGHLNTLTLHWLPLALLALHRMIERPRWTRVLAAGAAVTLASLSSDYYSFYVPAILLLSVPLLPWAHGRGLDRRRVAAILGAGLVTALLVGPVLYRYATVYGPVADGEGVVAPVDGLDLGDLLVMESRVWSPLLLPEAPETVSGAFFPGAVALLLGLLAAAGCLRRGESPTRRLVLWHGLVVLLALMFACGHRLTIYGYEGPRLPYYWLVEALPVINNLRAPYRAGFLALTVGAVLVGFGAARLLARIERPGRAIAVAIGLVLAMQLEMTGAAIPPDRPPAPRPIEGWLAEQPGDFGFTELPWPPLLYQSAQGQWRSTYHWKRRISGHSVLLPDDIRRLHARSRPMLDDEWVELLLERFPVRYVMVDVVAHGDEDESYLRSRLRALDGRLERQRRLGDVVVLRLHNGGPADGLRRRFAGSMVDGELVVELTEPVADRNVGRRFAARVDGEPLGSVQLRRGQRTIRLPVPRRIKPAELVWLTLRVAEGPPLVVRELRFEKDGESWP